MKTILFLFTFALLAIAAAPARPRESDLDSLVKAEKAFAAASVKKGMKEAFLEFLADGSVVFRPVPVDARKWFSERPAPQEVLSWFPTHAEVSLSGDMGFTTGPWELRKRASDLIPLRHGHFVSVWRKDRNGTWKVVVDVGTVFRQPLANVEEFKVPQDQPQAGRIPKADIPVARLGLMKAEQAFSGEIGEKGLISAYLSRALPQFLFLRIDTPPARGAEALRAALQKELGYWTWQPDAWDVSSSGDLGYTIGTLTIRQSADPQGPGETETYLRIWKRAGAGDWKLALDIANPVPPPPKAPPSSVVSP